MLSKFENEILAMGLYIQKVYDINVYGEHTESVETYLKQEKVDLNDLPFSQNVSINFTGVTQRDAYIAQANGLLARIIKDK
jgi:hypothetical protein